ncbi:MAG: helix-turn-helix domain-containing protein [Ktedonobacterales bacterium]
MSTPSMRKTLEDILEYAREGNMEEIIHTTQDALHTLNGGQLLTTREAASHLGIRSINTLKAIIIRHGIPYQRVGNRMMLSLSELEHLKHDPLMRGLRASEALHDKSKIPGADEGLTDEEMCDLEDTRPGQLPWKTQAQPRTDSATK